jgi:hypothetical protein
MRERDKQIGKRRSAIRRAFLPFCVILFFLFSLQPNILAATLNEYRTRIRTAGALTKSLIDDSTKKDFMQGLELERRALADLRKILPVSEKVEFKEASIETNNQWLYDRLDEYEKENNPEKRLTILTGIKERLWSIELKIDQLENPPAANRTKDEDKQKLGEILNREEYQKPKQQEKSFFQELLERIIKWFSRESPDPSVASSGGLQTLSFVLQIVLYAALIGGLGFLLYRFGPLFAGRLKQKEKREKKERVILGERIAADESSENLFSEAERLAREGNLRGAIRKGYVALLCELSDRKIIGLSRHKTNRDYLRDVGKRRELFESMSGLTSNFERHWYGFDEAEEKDWEDFRAGYRKAVAVGGSSRQ